MGIVGCSATNRMTTCREGWAVNAKRVYRLYPKEGLQLRHKTPKRKV